MRVGNTSTDKLINDFYNNIRLGQSISDQDMILYELAYRLNLKYDGYSGSNSMFLQYKLQLDEYAKNIKERNE